MNSLGAIPDALIPSRASGPLDVAPAAAARAEAFSRAMERDTGIERERRAVEAASQLVAIAFLEPMIASLRESPLAPESGPFSTNIVERRFGPMFDSFLSDRVAQAASFPLARVVADRLLGRAAAGPRAEAAGRLPERTYA